MSDLSRRGFLSLLGLGSGIVAVGRHGLAASFATNGSVKPAEYGEYILVEGKPASIEPVHYEFAVKRLAYSHSVVAKNLWEEHRILFDTPEPEILVGDASLPVCMEHDYGQCEGAPTPCRVECPDRTSIAWRNSGRRELPMEWDAADRAARAWLEDQPRLDDVLHAAWLKKTEEDGSVLRYRDPHGRS